MLIRGFNLAAADYRGSRRQRALASLAAAALALILLAQGAYWVTLRREASGVGARVAGMEAEVRSQEERLRGLRGGVPAEAVKAYQARVTEYNRILEASAFSWTGLLFELERAVPPHVELRDIQPELSSGKVTLVGTTRSFDDLSHLLRALSQRTAFQDVYLLRQAEKRPEASSGRAAREEVSFTVTLVYAGRPR